MNFKLYKTIITYKVICTECNQHFTVIDITNIVCKNCNNKGNVNE